MSWNELAAWWIEEVQDDPAYEAVVTPLLIEVLQPVANKTYLDLGCGDGRVMRTMSELGASPIGVEISPHLAALATKVAPTTVGRLPDLSYIRADSFDGAYCVLVLEHIEDTDRFFLEAARAVKSGGELALVINHPTWTAPLSTPITDTDGEVFWRPGEYFSLGYTDQPAGGSTVRFHHRSMSDLLNAAARAGWALDEMIEQPHHDLEDQKGIPRLLACRWHLVP